MGIANVAKAPALGAGLALAGQQAAIPAIKSTSLQSGRT